MRVNLTIMLLIVAFVQVSAEALAQKVTLSKNDVSLKEVFDEINRQTGYNFLWSAKQVSDTFRIDVHLEKEPVESALRQILTGLPLSYRIVEKTIIINGKRTTGANAGARPGPDPLTEKEDTQQPGPVRGIVTDTADLPLPGVTVMIKGTNQGTSTDIDGGYSLPQVQENATLIFSFIGYKSLELPVNGRTQIDAVLQMDLTGLKEVVVVGYGTVEKDDLTGSVSSIKSEELLDRPAVNVGQALSGKIAGVEVFNNSGRPDGQIRIRIRGNNSITASNEPLYVIDGVIGVADVNLLNPNNIESLQVLKDASATAIYGARGANGVILITTKRGQRADKGTIGYDGYTSFGVMAKKQNIEFLNAEEWWQVYNTGFDNIEKYDPIGYAQGKFQRATPESLPALFDSAGNPIYDTDWEEETYRTAVSHSHQLSFSGGNDKTTHRVYLNYLRQEALMDKNYLERYNGQFNVDSELKNWLKVGVNASLNYNKGNDLYDNYRLKRLAQEALPIIPVRYPDGAWGSNRDFPGAVQDTPLRYLEEMTDETTNVQITSDFYLDFHLAKDLDLRSTFAVDYRNRKNNYYVGKNLIQFSGKTSGGLARINTEYQTYWQNENYVNWNKQFDENNKLNLMLGLSWQQRSAELLGAEHRNFIDDFYQWHNLGSGTVVQPSSSADWRWALNSYFARLNYSLYNKYLFTVTGRYDGSSKFGKNNKYAFFPSVAVAWQLSEEDFLKGSGVIDHLKIRASAGRTGNQEIANYAYSQDLGSSNVIFADEFYSALYRSSFGNPNLKWETTTQVDAGIDVVLLNGRIDVAMDYYHKLTSDLLLNAPIPYTSGLDAVMQNIGSVRNSGFELALNTFPVSGDHFSWKLGIAFSANRNKIIKLGANNEDIFPTRHAQGDMQILRVGEPIGAFWGLIRLGTWGTDEAEEAGRYNRLPGDLKFADLNNDGKIDENDNTIIGRSTPDWTMGIGNAFTYKNVDLSFDIRVVQGIDVMNAGTHNREDRSGVANGSKTLLDAWTPSNQETMIAELRYMKTYYDSYPDTHWLQDGSFVRLQNLSIGYTFNNAFLNKAGFRNGRIYLSGQNLFLLTKYKGYDPEVRTIGGAFGQGIDDFGEPRARTYTIGLSFNL